jgi:hypothetical protein
VFVGDLLLNLFPFYPEGGIAEHEVEGLSAKLIVREGIAQLDSLHRLPFYEHVGLTDRV